MFFSEPCSGQIGQGRRAAAGRDQRRPLMRAECHRRRQERRHAALFGFVDNGRAAVAAHQFVIHQVVMPKKAAPTERSETMRVSASSISSGVVVNEIVSISTSLEFMASGPKNCASTLNNMLFCRAT